MGSHSTTPAHKMNGPPPPDSIQLCEIVHFDRGRTEDSDSSDGVDNLNILPPLSALQVTIPDVAFNFVVWLFTLLQFTVDLALVVWHIQTGHQWGAAVTCFFFGVGGVALLNHFWIVPRDQIKSIYTHGTGVRVWVNSLPWLATPITSFQSTTASHASRTNPMITPRYVKLDELSRNFLKVQGFAQSAPQAVVQLVLLLEDLHHISAFKATTTMTSIITNLTIMTVANLPGKSDLVQGTIPKAAYSPKSRLFIGLRMISSFASRTMSLSLLFTTFRCIWLEKPVTFLPHLIPILIVTTPRLLFSITDCIASRIKPPEQRPKQVNILLSYLATIFFPFGEPKWVFWYVTVETIIYMIFGVVSVLVFDTAQYCVHTLVCTFYSLVFCLLFFFVPCFIPYVRGRTRATL